MTTICPECETGLDLPERPKVNEVFECGDCRSELEIVSVEPLMVALAPEVEEDWGE